jgi:prepilin-type N-terminal cleavage/methylation domain-containing protein
VSQVSFLKEIKGLVQRIYKSSSGFTLIEITLVLVIIGIILSVAVISWMSIKHGYEISQTRSKLRAVKSCLIKRMIYTERYPTYSKDLTVNSVTGECVNYNSSKDVDYCICQDKFKDAWGNRIRYLGGVNGSGSALSGELVLNSTYKHSEPYQVPDEYSNATKPNGDVIKDLAFVLVSYGQDGSADDSSYNSSALVGTLNASTGNPSANSFKLPDFSSNDLYSGTQDGGDDQVLFITGYELKSKLN